MRGIIEEIRGDLNNSTDWDIRMYVIDDKSHRKNPEDMFEVYSVGIKDGAENYFKDILFQNLDEIIHIILENRDEIDDFFSRSMEEPCISTIDCNEIQTLSECILNQINQSDDLPTLENIDDIGKIRSYAVEIKTDIIPRIIYFVNFTPRKILSSHQENDLTIKKVFSLQDGYFDSVEGDIFTIEGNIDCIYAENVRDHDELMIIKNRGNFEIIFNFREFYFRNMRQIFESPEFISLVELSDDLKENLIKKVSYAKKINSMLRTRSIDSTLIGPLERCITRLPSINYSIDDGKIRINDEEGFRDFIDGWGDNFANTIAFDELYRVWGKKRL